MKIGLFYGTTSAATEEVANLIQENLESCEVELFDIYKEPLEKISEFENIIIGCPTWDIGLLQEDWRSKFDELDSIDFSNKKVSIQENKEKSHGDYASNLAMVVAKDLSQTPREVAEQITSLLGFRGFYEFAYSNSGVVSGNQIGAKSLGMYRIWGLVGSPQLLGVFHIMSL